ncbi:hypothetical protein FSHL1_010495 [Fusarium sambucinum]
MGDPQAVAPTQHGLHNSKKRPHRFMSDSPSQAPPGKKNLFEQEWYDMVEESTPISDSLPFTAVLDYINTCESPALTDQIDTWLEETYPSEINTYDQHLQACLAAGYKLRGSGSAAEFLSPEPPVLQVHVANGVEFRDSLQLQNESLNLAANNIIYRDRREELPEHISQLVQKIESDRQLLDISVQDVYADDALAALERGAGEPNVEQYIQNTLVTLPPRNDILKRSDKIPMSKWTIPNTGTAYRVSGPVPDILLGYNFATAFTPLQRMKLASMHLDSSNRDGLCLPFLIVELKGDGPSSNGSL